MADGRKRNNQTAGQRRAAVYNRRKRPPKVKKVDLLAKAKDVLRRTGKTVFAAKIDEPRFVGTVIVDTRRLGPEAVIEMAETILVRENLRNNELRTQHALEPLPLKTLKDL